VVGCVLNLYDGIVLLVVEVVDCDTSWLRFVGSILLWLSVGVGGFGFSFALWVRGCGVMFCAVWLRR